MIYTTLNKIREHSPCKDGLKKLLKTLNKTKADDEPLSLEFILDSNGLDDALWCLRTIPEHDKLWRLYAVWCARRVQHLMTDERGIKALDVAEAYARGEATDNDLEAAWASARYAARNTELDAAREAVSYASNPSAWSAARAAAWYASRVSARPSKRYSARYEQEAKFREIIKIGEV